MWLYEVGRWYGAPLLPFKMMVVDVSPCGRFVTFAMKTRAGLVVERVLVRGDQEALLKPPKLAD